MWADLGSHSSIVHTRPSQTTTLMHDDFFSEIESLAPRFEALGLNDIGARLRALASEPPRLGALLQQQILSILDDAEEL